MTQPRNPIRLALTLAAAGLLLAACSDATAQGGPAPAPRVAFFEDMSVPDTLDTVLPASLSMQAYLRAQTDAGAPASFQLVPFDTQGDASVALADAKTVANDPSYVAAVAAPFWIEPSQTAEALANGGVPVLNLSADGTAPNGGSGGWMSLVAGLDAQTQALAALAATQAESGPVCEGGDATRWSVLVADGVEAAAPAMHPVALPLDATAAAASVSQHGCRAVLWTGFAPAGQELRALLGPSVAMVGADGMTTWSYLTSAPAGTASFVACSCADVNTSTEPRVQTFINGDQVATGLTPGAFAAEAWDASGILAGALRAGLSRAAVRAGLSGLRSYRGVARTYRFDPAVPLSALRYRGIGSRWIPAQAP